MSSSAAHVEWNPQTPAVGQHNARRFAAHEHGPPLGRLPRPEPEGDFQSSHRAAPDRERDACDCARDSHADTRPGHGCGPRANARRPGTGRRQTSETARNHRPGSTAIPDSSAPTGLPGCGAPRPGPAPDCRVSGLLPMARGQNSRINGRGISGFTRSATRFPNDSKVLGLSTPRSSKGTGADVSSRGHECRDRVL